MRSLFLFCLLSLSLALQAGQPQLITVPYYPVLADTLTMEDDKACQTQARISAKALQNARLEVTLEDQLKIWDDFTASEAGKLFSPEELKMHRRLIVIAWNIAEKFPDVKPNEYGDYVYSSCAGTKLNKTVTF